MRIHRNIVTYDQPLDFLSHDAAPTRPARLRSERSLEELERMLDQQDGRPTSAEWHRREAERLRKINYDNRAHYQRGQQ
jgi:hypothetical protein